MNIDLVTYYKNRAAEYESIYLKPERQADLQSVSAILQTLLTGKQVLEIACGTGYWTERIAQTTASIYATDINDSVLKIAGHKNYPGNNVRFGIADFNHWQPLDKFNGLFAGFIWSHIPLQDLRDFISKINRFVSPGSTVVLMDNNYVEGSNTSIAFTDEKGNTYQDRKLQDGSVHRVLKNFPTEEFIRQTILGLGTVVNFITLEYFWILVYTAA
jgi:ubiquinone/menaquinone biosynthesis C-methylase UbiE